MMATMRGFGKKRGDRGFTLLEVLVATTIVAVVFTGIFRLFGGTLRSIMVSEKYVYAVIAGEQKMNEILLAEDGIKPMTESGSFDENPDYAYDLEITVYEPDDGLVESFDLTDIKDKVVIYEINLKVSWKERRKTKSLDLATLKTVVEENRS